MIRSLLMWPCALILIAVGLAGCTETVAQGTISPSGVATPLPVVDTFWPGSGRSMVFPTDDLRDLLADRGHAPGFVRGDWEYSRNNSHVSVRAAPLIGPEQSYEIAVYDAQWESNGIPRSNSRIERWSVRRGRARP